MESWGTSLCDKKKIISLKSLPLSPPKTETKQGERKKKKEKNEKPLSDMERHCNLYTIKYHLFD